MCGIAGFSNFNDFISSPEREIKAMCDAIEHRGPDEWGFDILPQLVLGHRRLSIVGLADGKQPIKVGDYGITFNGEIYNYRDLKKELEADGVKFQTSTDTEVLLHLYIKHGVEAFKKINGMFAFAIWDPVKEQIVMARDRMGKKPLFYYRENSEIIFASELKALVKNSKFKKRLSMPGLDKFFTYEYIPSPATIFENTFKVEAGEFLVVSKNSFHKEFFWNYPSSDPLAKQDLDEGELVAEIEKILTDAVDIRLQADVPVGVFLSGGIDSSLVTAIAQKQNRSNHKIKSFSIYFNEKSYDESEYIEQIAKKFDLEHHYDVVSAKDMLSLIDRLGGIMDEPMADPSLVPTYFLSEIASREVKTVLGGDGADEMFAGYPTYIANKLVNIYNIVPYDLRNFVTKLFRDRDSSLIPVSAKNMSWDHLIKQFFRGTGTAGEVRFFRWMGGFLEREKNEVYSEKFKSSLDGHLPYEDLSRYLSRVNIFSDLGRLLYLSQRLYMMDDILVKVDRASMQNSLEVRAPFLDYRLVEYVSNIPDRYKLKGFKTKYILKKLARKYLPSQIIDRPKKGFGIPISEWLCTDLKEPMLDLLSESHIKSQGIFEYAGIKELIDGHLSGKTNNRKLLWSLLCFQLWAKEFAV